MNILQKAVIRDIIQIFNFRLSPNIKTPKLLFHLSQRLRLSARLNRILPAFLAPQIAHIQKVKNQIRRNNPQRACHLDPPQIQNFLLKNRVREKLLRVVLLVYQRNNQNHEQSAHFREEINYILIEVLERLQIRD